MNLEELFPTQRNKNELTFLGPSSELLTRFFKSFIIVVTILILDDRFVTSFEKFEMFSPL
jgi:hypothetical protein